MFFKIEGKNGKELMCPNFRVNRIGIHTPGPSCSKLTTSLVNDSLKFTLSDMLMC